MDPPGETAAAAAPQPQQRQMCCMWMWMWQRQEGFRREDGGFGLATRTTRALQDHNSEIDLPRSRSDEQSTLASKPSASKD
eukprot:scaffold30384_cov72-Skeletonema_dohrnii-CCMP3373.AAC.1